MPINTLKVKRWYGSVFKMPVGRYRLVYQGSLSAMIRCPECGNLITMKSEHYIAFITIPDVICLEPRCKFSSHVYLMPPPSPYAV